MDLHEEGRFRATALEGDYGRAQTGTEQVAVLFKLETGAQLTWYGYLSENAADRTLESLVHCGVSDLATLADLGSKDVEVVVQHDTYEGKTRARIAFVNALGSGGVAMKNKASEADKASIAKRFKGNFLKLQKQHGDAPAASSASKPRAKATGTDDDIPF